MSLQHWSRLHARLSKPDFQGGSLLVGFDFDGTLADFAETPEDAALTRETRGLLARLSRRPDVRIAILSGRSLADLKSVAALRNVYYAGNHGLVIEGPGLRWTHPRAQPIGDSILRRLEEDLRSYPGAFIERKRFGFALHYRRMPARFHKSLRALVRRRMPEIPAGWRLGEGDKTFDVRPDIDWGKGHALETIRRALPGGWLSLFVGDAGTDEEGFHTLGPRALTIRVGRVTASAAQYLVPERRQVDRLLELLLERRRPDAAQAV